MIHTCKTISVSHLRRYTLRMEEGMKTVLVLHLKVSHLRKYMYKMKETMKAVHLRVLLT